MSARGRTRYAPTTTPLDEVRRTLDLYSPVSGYVTQKMALHGMRVTPVDTLFDIADLSHLWVMADVYESKHASCVAS